MSDNLKFFLLFSVLAHVLRRPIIIVADLILKASKNLRQFCRSGIRFLFNPWIRDEYFGSYFRFVGLRYLNSLMRMRMRIRDQGILLSLDPGWKRKKFGSGIPDKHPGSATLIKVFKLIFKNPFMIDHSSFLLRVFFLLVRNLKFLYRESAALYCFMSSKFVEMFFLFIRDLLLCKKMVPYFMLRPGTVSGGMLMAAL